MPSNKVPLDVVRPGPGEAGDATVSASALDFDASASGGGGGGEIIARVPWADGTANPAARLGVAIAKIVADLTSTANKRGAGKLTAPALSDWADGTTNPATTVADAIDNIIRALTSTNGAGKVSIGALSAWADSAATANNSPTTSAAIDKIIKDLTSTTDTMRGLGKITAPALTGSPVAVTASKADVVVQSVLDAVNAEILRCEQRAEAAAVHAIKPIWIQPGAALNAITARSPLNNPRQESPRLYAVGENATILSRSTLGAPWVASTGASGFTGSFNGVAVRRDATPNYIVVGDSGEIQTSSNVTTWTYVGGLRGTADWNDVVYGLINTSTSVFVLVGDSGRLATLTTGSTISIKTAPTGMTTENYVSVAYGAGVFVAVTDTGKMITSPDGNTWTKSTTGDITSLGSAQYLPRQLRYHPSFGFAAMHCGVSGASSWYGMVTSVDGIAWTVQPVTFGVGALFTSANLAVDPAWDRTSSCVAFLDRQYCVFSSSGPGSAAPYILNASLRTTGGASTHESIDNTAVLNIMTGVPQSAIGWGGAVYVVGKLNNGDGFIAQSAPYRPNTVASK